MQRSVTRRGHDQARWLFYWRHLLETQSLQEGPRFMKDTPGSDGPNSDQKSKQAAALLALAVLIPVIQEHPGGWLLWVGGLAMIKLVGLAGIYLLR